MFGRKARAALAAAAILMSVTACGSAGGAQGPSRPAGGDITFWSFVKGSDAVADAFNRTHPGIKVKFETQASGPDYYNKLSNAVKSGAVPDVAVAEYVRLPEIVSLGGAEDLTGAVGPMVDKTFPDSIKQLVTLGGKTWGVPRDAAPMLYYYRKDFFDSHKLSVPKTWDGFTQLASKVKSIDPHKSAAVYLTADSNLQMSLSWQAGADWFGTEGDSWKVRINDQASQKVAAYWQNLVSSKLVTPVPTTYADEFWQGVQGDRTVGYFCATWCAGGLQSTVPDQSGKWAVAELPSWDAKPSSAMWGGSSFIVPKGAKNPAAAAEFIKWITTDPQGIASWYGSGTSSMYPAAPNLVPVAEKGFKTTYFGGQDLFTVATASYDAVPPAWMWGPAMATTDTALVDGLGKVVDGSSGLADVIGTAQQQTVQIMKSRGLKVDG
jgi:multiple sugar transport system substrate-binding protein